MSYQGLQSESTIPLSPCPCGSTQVCPGRRKNFHQESLSMKDCSNWWLCHVIGRMSLVFKWKRMKAATLADCKSCPGSDWDQGSLFDFPLTWQPATLDKWYVSRETFQDFHDLNQFLLGHQTFTFKHQSAHGLNFDPHPRKHPKTYWSKHLPACIDINWPALSQSANFCSVNGQVEAWENHQCSHQM